MIDNSYMTRGVNSDGVAPLKQNTEQDYRNSLLSTFHSRPRGQYTPYTGESNDTLTDANIGDLSFLSPDEIEERRYKEQSALNQLWRGMKNSFSIAGATFADMFLGNAATLLTGTYDNAVHNALQRWQENMLESNPVHRSYSYDQRNFWQKLGSTVTWADIVQNSGYTTGMLAGSAALGATGLGGTVIVPAVLGAMSEAATEATQVKNELLKNREQSIVEEYNKRLSSVRTPEQKQELDSWFSEKYREAEQDVRNASNITYGANTALLLASNMIGWGSILKSSTNLLKGLANKELVSSSIDALGLGVKAVGKNGKKLGKIAADNIDDLTILSAPNKAWTRTKNIASYLGSAASESGEEVSQGIISDFAKENPSVSDFSLTSDYDVRHTIDEYVNTFNQIIKDAFNDKDTAMEAFMGAFTSLVGVPGFKNTVNSKGKVGIGLTWNASIKELFEQEKQDKRLRDTVDKANELISNNKTSDLINNLVRTMTLSKRKELAAANKDTFQIKNYDLAELVSTVVTFDDLKRMDILDAIIDKASNLSDEDLLDIKDSLVTENGNSIFTNNTDITEIRNFINKNTTELKDLIKEYKETKDIIESNGVNLSLDGRNNYIYGRALNKDLNRRRELLSEELYTLFGNVVDEEGNPLTKEEFSKAVASDAAYRNTLLNSLKYNLTITPDIYSKTEEALRDIKRIDDALVSINSEMSKIWNNPQTYIEELLILRDKQIEENRKKEILNKIKDEIDTIANSDFPINDFFSDVNSFTPEEIYLMIEHFKNSNNPKLKALAKDIDSIYDDMSVYNEALEGTELENLLEEARFNISDIFLSTIVDFGESNEEGITRVIEEQLHDIIKNNLLKSNNLTEEDKANIDSKVEEILDEFYENINDIEKTKSALDDNKNEEEADDEEGVEDTDEAVEKQEIIDYIVNKKGINIDEVFPDYENMSSGELYDALEEYLDTGKSPVSNKKNKAEDAIEDSETTEEVKGELLSWENTPDTDNIKEIVDSKDSRAKTNKKALNNTENSISGKEDGLAVGRLSAKYDIEELKDHHNAVPNEHDSYGREVLEECGYEEFISSGKLDKWIRDKKKNNEPLTVGFCRIIDNNQPFRSGATIFACIETKDGNTVVYDDNGIKHKVQIIGVVSKTENSDSEDSLNYLKSIPRNRNKNQLFPVATTLAHFYSGRMVLYNENYPMERDNKGNIIRTHKNLLDIMPKKKDNKVDTSRVQIVIKTMGKDLTIGKDLDGELLPLNTNNPNDNLGVIWLRVLEHNGQITHKYVKIKSLKYYDYEDNKDTPIVKEITSILRKIIEHRDNIDKIKGLLSELHNYLQITPDKKLSIIPQADKAVIRGIGEVDLSSPKVLDELISLIWRAEYKLNIGRGRLTLEQVIESDILMTELAELYNVENSILLNTFTVDEEGNVEVNSSNAATYIKENTHTGKKGFQKGKNTIYAKVNNLEYQKIDDRYYKKEGNKLVEVTSNLEKALVDTYLKIITGDISPIGYYKTKKNKVFEIKPVGSISSVLAIYNESEGIRLMTENEIKDRRRAMRGLPKTKEKVTTVQIGNRHVALHAFGKNYYSQEPIMSISKKGNSYVQNNEPKEEDLESAVLLGYEDKKDPNIIIIAPNIKSKKFRHDFYAGDVKITKYFKVESKPIGKVVIPYVEEPAIATKDGEKTTITKGKIVWKAIDELENKTTGKKTDNKVVDDLPLESTLVSNNNTTDSKKEETEVAKPVAVNTSKSSLFGIPKAGNRTVNKESKSKVSEEVKTISNNLQKLGLLQSFSKFLNVKNNNDLNTVISEYIDDFRKINDVIEDNQMSSEDKVKQIESIFRSILSKKNCN